MYKYFLPLAVLLAYLVYRATSAPAGDFAGYYFGSLELWRGNVATAYDTASLNLAILQKGFTGVFVSYTPFPPFTALAVAPFLLLPVAAAKLAFNLFSVIVFLISLYRAFKFFSVPWWVALVLPVIFCIPLRNNIILGQSYLLLTAWLLEGLIAYKKGKVLPAALLWSFAMVFKIFPVFVLFYLLVRKEYRQFWYCVGFAACWGLLSVVCLGFEPWRLYVFELMPRLNNGELNDGYTYVFQSAFMLLKNLFVYDKMQNADVVLNSPLLFGVLNAAFKALILAACIGVHKRVDFGVWVLGSLLISPNGSSYSLVLLVVPLLLMEERRVAIVLLLVACNLPVQWFEGLPVLLQYPRLYLLLAFFVVMVWGVRLPYRLGLVFCAVLLLMVRVPKRDEREYLVKGRSPLIYDFTVKDGSLVYFYFDTRGVHEVKTGYKVNNFRMLGRREMLVNEKDVVYLSDENRGIGFYTLRLKHFDD